MADKALKREGIRWGWFVAGIVAVGLMFRFAAVNGSGFVVGKMLGNKRQELVESPAPTNTILHAGFSASQAQKTNPSNLEQNEKFTAAAVAPAKSLAQNARQDNNTYEASVADEKEKPADVFITGITTFNGLRVYLSSVDLLDPQTPGVEAVMREGVRYKGRIYRLGKALPLELVSN